jgi:predicted HicB family RNase H-like nuclease
MDLHYSASVAWSEEDDEFVALCPEFRGASGSGDTAEEALAQLQESITVLLQTYADQGLNAPEPRMMEEFSGQVRLRLPKELHRELAIAAERQGVSLNTLFVTYLAQGLGRGHEQAEIVAQLQSLIATNRALVAYVGASSESKDVSAPSLVSGTSPDIKPTVSPFSRDYTLGVGH